MYILLFTSCRCSTRAGWNDNNGVKNVLNYFALSVGRPVGGLGCIFCEISRIYVRHASDAARGMKILEQLHTTTTTAAAAAAVITGVLIRSLRSLGSTVVYFSITHCPSPEENHFHQTQSQH
jgi:hypothetical protein